MLPHAAFGSGPRNIDTMQTAFTYDCSPRSVHLCVLIRSRSTGKERDTESGLDNFGFRYYASNMGRWMSPDPSGLAFADPTNPQSLNLYSYVLNNPLSFTDPDGLECVWDDGSFDSADDKQTGSHGGCSSQGGTYVDPKAFGTLSVRADGAASVVGGQTRGVR
jgi:RHS repeat-associated protein